MTENLPERKLRDTNKPSFFNKDLLKLEIPNNERTPTKGKEMRYIIIFLEVSIFIKYDDKWCTFNRIRTYNL